MSKKILIILAGVAGLALLGFGLWWVERQSRLAQFNEYIQTAQTAWDNNDCHTIWQTIPKSRDFSDVGDIPGHLNDIQSPCGALFVTIFPNTGQEPAGDTLLRYLDLLQQMKMNSQSEKIVAKMKEVVAPQIQQLFETTPAAQLASESLCTQLFELREDGLIANPEVNIPLLYDACAGVFLDVKRYGEAAALYQTLLDEYPAHELSANALEKQEKAWLREAESPLENAGTGLWLVSLEGVGNPTITVQNEGYQELWLTLSGLYSQKQKADACAGCEKHNYKLHPECIGPTTTFEIQPGTYIVVADAYGLDGEYQETWHLQKGATYYACFSYSYIQPLLTPRVP